MKSVFYAITIAAAAGATAQAADWEALKRTPAQVEVVNMQAMPLQPGGDKKSWSSVPAQLTKYNATIYVPSGNTNGVADIKVTEGGFLMLACNYDYQGNSMGKWDDEDWNEKKFRTKGWHLMSKTELGGILVKGDNRAQVIFSKQVRSGETFRIRCNKYDPPYPIVLPAK